MSFFVVTSLAFFHHFLPSHILTVTIPLFYSFFLYAKFFFSLISLLSILLQFLLFSLFLVFLKFPFPAVFLICFLAFFLLFSFIAFSFDSCHYPLDFIFFFFLTSSRIFSFSIHLTFYLFLCLFLILSLTLYSSDFFFSESTIPSSVLLETRVLFRDIRVLQHRETKDRQCCSSNSSSTSRVLPFLPSTRRDAFSDVPKFLRKFLHMNTRNGTISQKGR